MHVSHPSESSPPLHCLLSIPLDAVNVVVASGVVRLRIVVRCLLPLPLATMDVVIASGVGRSRVAVHGCQRRVGTVIVLATHECPTGGRQWQQQPWFGMLELRWHGHVAAFPPHSCDGDRYALGEGDNDRITLWIIGCDLHPDRDDCGGGSRCGAAGGWRCNKIVCLLLLPLGVAAGQ
jgi:hypothetical protein